MNVDWVTGQSKGELDDARDGEFESFSHVIESNGFLNH